MTIDRVNDEAKSNENNCMRSLFISFVSHIFYIVYFFISTDEGVIGCQQEPEHLPIRYDLGLRAIRTI